MKIVSKLLLTSIAALAVGLSLSAKEERFATAAQSDLQYGYVQAAAICEREYGGSFRFGLRSGIIAFCPYDPNKPDFASDASYPLQQAADASCMGGTARITSTPYVYPWSSAGEAWNAHNQCSGFTVCVDIAYSGGYYSPMNNAVNCHP